MHSKNKEYDSEIRNSALAILKKFYGYPSFYPLQYEAIESVMKGEDAVVLMPTGGGKSICFQIPALLFPGCTIVVSPLISLMKDQVDALCTNGIPAASINSTQDEASNREIINKVFSGRIKLLYISPERLLADMNMWSSELNISFIAIDEAHCISQWGHDFRPEYTQLSQIKKRFPKVPIMALTATADKLTRQDISTQLGISEAKLFLTSFDRKNLSLNVIVKSSGRQRLQKILSIINSHKDESGIIYCLSRKTTESVAEQLKNLGYNAACYHAGLNNNVRTNVQKQFLNDEIQIICATIAFGMGINKSNVRWVVHYNMPKNIESYYQEIGRAGRDGLKSDTYMFYSYGDVITLTSFVNESGQKSMNLDKLRRMQEYAESHICRRRILLSYFNERYESDCCNCDVCNNPPNRIDGTVIAQMALSAIARCEEKIGHTMTIDILRGSHKTDLISHNYHKIKTYGIGRNLTFNQWNYYLMQFLQLGLIEIAYDEGNSFKITSYGYDVLKGSKKILISEFTYEENIKKEKAPKRRKIEEITINPNGDILNALKILRGSLAKELGVPAYIIFSDKILQIMATEKPTTKEAFSNLYGVGENKTERFWKPFTDVVKKYVN